MICPACFAPSQRTERYWYYSRHGKGRQYRRHCRRAVAHPEVPPSEHDSLEYMRQEKEEVLLDEDELAGVCGIAACSAAGAPVPAVGAPADGEGSSMPFPQKRCAVILLC